MAAWREQQHGSVEPSFQDFIKFFAEEFCWGEEVVESGSSQFLAVIVIKLNTFKYLLEYHYS